MHDITLHDRETASALAGPQPRRWPHDLRLGGESMNPPQDPSPDSPEVTLKVKEPEPYPD